MQEFLLGIINSGLRSSQTNLERRTIKLINLISLLSIGVAALSLLYTLFAFGPVGWGMASGLICIANYSTVLWLNRRGRFNGSRWLIVLYTNISFILVAFTLDHRIRPEIVFLSSFPVYVAIFERARTIVIVSAITLLVLEAGIYLQLLDIVEPRVDAGNYNLLLIYLPQVAISAAIILFITYFFKQTSRQYESHLRQSNDELRRSLEINRGLMREVHHRVKNNLQIVSGLLDLQQRKVVDRGAVKALTESSRRIEAISLVHQLLYQDDEVSRISLQPFTERLVGQLIQVYQDPGRCIVIEQNVDDLRLDTDKAVAIGLILTEILSNSFKHAFAGRDAGRIQIGFSVNSENRGELKIADDGCGMPDDAGTVNTSQTMGLYIVELMVEQLDARMTRSSESGLNYFLEIPLAANVWRPAPSADNT